MGVRPSLSRAFRAISFNFYTAFLFTKSDIKTIVAPTMCCVLAAILSSPGQVLKWEKVSALAKSLLWCWLNLLIFNIENQTRSYSIVEDHVNKKWRPIPSNRITLPTAKSCRYIAILVCAIYSHHHGVNGIAILFLCLGILYNNTIVHEIAFARNIFCALAYAIMGLGADIVALRSYRRIDTMTTTKPLVQKYLYDWTEVDPLIYQWLAILSAVVLSTIHVSDFPDMEGDRKLGRRTLPLVIGVSRVTKLTVYTIMGWSAFLAFISFTSATIFAYGILALGMVVCNMLLREQGDVFSQRVDRAYLFYTIWLALVAFAPVFDRTK